MALVLITLSGCERASIEGVVIDNFGDPVGDVLVAIVGTSVTATTKGDGEYSIPYMPGTFTVLLTKEGYVADSITYTLSQKDVVPAQEIVLYRIPSGHGMYVVDEEYIPLAKGTVRTESEEYPFSFDGPLFKYWYVATGIFTEIGERDTLVIVDTDPVIRTIMKLNDRDLILAETRYWARNELSNVNEVVASTEEITEGLWEWRIAEPTGRYAFVARSEGSKLGFRNVSPIESDIYLLQVGKVRTDLGGGGREDGVVGYKSRTIAGEALTKKEMAEFAVNPDRFPEMGDGHRIDIDMVGRAADAAWHVQTLNIRNEFIAMTYAAWYTGREDAISFARVKQPYLRDEGGNVYPGIPVIGNRSLRVESGTTSVGVMIFKRRASHMPAQLSLYVNTGHQPFIRVGPFRAK